jgi:hypothetical protein
MGHEEANGTLPSPTPENQARYEEWCRKQEEYWASLPRQLTEEEAEQFRDMAWAEQDPEVQRLYAYKWVAVYRRKVVAAGDDLGEVLAEASRVTGLPEGKIAVTSIPGIETFFGGR